MKSRVEKAEKLPLLKIFFPVVSGIITVYYLPVNSIILGYFPILSLVFSLLYFAFRFLESSAPKPSQIFLSGICLSNSMFFISGWIFLLSTSTPILPDAGTYQYLNRPFSLKTNSKGNTTYICEVQQISEGRILPDQMKLELRYDYNFKGDSLILGQNYVTELRIIKFPEAFVPGEFDYASYMADQGVYLTGYINRSVKLGSGKSIQEEVFSMQNYRTQLITLISLDGKSEEAALLTAFIAGDKTELDKETKTAFSETGTMHLLAVSGLHVGILFLILDTLLPWKKAKQILRLKRALFIVCLIWFYAFITGASPSVLRSALMISVIVPGRSTGKFPPALNSLAVAGCILLFYDPNMLFAIGFQLSFLAITGILIIQPIIRDVFVFKSGLMNKVWGLIAVTLAAQIATSPIVFYYFNTFPVYFLPANLICVPLAPFVLTGGLIETLLNYAQVDFDWLHFLALLPAKLLLIIVEFFASLPWKIIENIFLELHQVLILYVCIFSLLMWSKYASALYLNIVLILLSFSLFFSFYSKVKMTRSEELLIYSFEKKPWMVYRNGFNAIAFPVYHIRSKDDFLKQKISKHMKRIGVELTFPVPISKTGIKVFQDLAIAFEDSLQSLKEDSINHFRPDILILNSKKQLEDPTLKFNDEILVLNFSEKSLADSVQSNRIINIKKNSLISIDPKDYFSLKD